MYDTPQNNPKRSLIPWVIISLLVVFVVGSCSLTTYMSLDRTFSFFESGMESKSFKSKKFGSSNVIAQLNVDGVIMGSRNDLFEALEEIEDGVKDKKIKGLLININSPGGSVAPTQDIYSRMIELRKSVPVICSMNDVAASGGYYIAAACEEIFALPGTTTGSIGVIFQFFNVEDLVAWAKLKSITLKAGKMKDVGSPFRSLKPEEQAYLQNLLNEVHEQFIGDVAKGRAKKITEEVLRSIADGRILTGQQALKYGLVDKSGSSQDALKWLKENKQLGDLEVVKLPRPKSKLEGFLSNKSDLKFDLLQQFHPFQGLVPMLLPAYYQGEQAR